MSDDVVGSASIRVTPDLDAFEEDLKAGVEEATAGDDGEVRIKLGLDDAEYKAGLAEDDALAKAIGGDASQGWDAFAPVEEINQLSEAMDKAGVDADAFSDRMEKAGIAEEDLTRFADESGVGLDDLVSHMDAAGTSSKKMTDYFQQSQTVFDSMGDYSKSLVSSMDDLDERANKIGDDFEKVGDDGEKVAVGMGDAGRGADSAARSFDNASQSASDAESGMSGLITAAVLLGPALIPVAGAVAAAVIGIGGGLLAAGLGIGAFALAAAPELGNVKDQAESLLHSFQNLVKPEVMPVLNGSIDILHDALQAAIPLVGSAAQGLQEFEGEVSKAMDTTAWRSFTTFIDAEAGPAIHSFGNDILNLGHGFANLLETFAPVEQEMEVGLEHLTASFENWTSSTGGSQTFLQWFETHGPAIGQLFENLATLVGHLLTAFGGYGEILITVLNPVLELTNALLALNPVVGDIAVGILVAGVAWAKFGSTIGGVIRDFDNLGSIAAGLSKAETGIGSLAAKVADLGPVSSSASLGVFQLTDSEEGLTASETEATAAAQREAAALGELGLAAQNAAVDQGELSATSLTSAGEIGGIGEAAEGAGIGLAGAAEGAGVLTSSLGLGIATLGLGALALGVFAAGSIIANEHMNDLNKYVNQATESLSGMGVKTLPQVNSALKSNQDLLQGQAEKYLLSQGASQTWIDGLTRVQQQQEAYNQAQHTGDEESDAYIDIQSKVFDQDAKLNAQKQQLTSNLDKMSSSLGITNSQSQQLADTLGINLNKSISGLQIDQAREYLKQLADQTGITESALQELANGTTISMTALEQAANSAGQATQKAFSGSEDALQSLGGTTAQTSGDLLSFYQNQETQVSAFATNIQAALQEGYDPKMILQMEQEGYQQSGGLLQQMVTDGSQGYVQQVKDAEAALDTANKAAVKNSQLMSYAVQSNNKDLLATLPQLAAVSNAETQAAITGNVGAAVSGLNSQFPGWEAAAKKWGIQIPQSFKDNVSQTGTQAEAQGKAATTGTLTSLLGQANAANQLAQATPNAFTKAYAAAADNAYNQAAAAAGGTTKGKPLVDAAAKPVGDALPTAIGAKLKETGDAGAKQVGAAATAITNGLNPMKADSDKAASSLPDSIGAKINAAGTAGANQVAASSQAIFNGLNPIKANSDTAANSLPLSIGAKIAAAGTAGTNQVTAAAQGITAGIGIIASAAGLSGQAVPDQINQKTPQSNAAGAAHGTQTAAGLTAQAGTVTAAANKIGTSIVDGINQGATSKQGDLNSTLLSEVKSAISHAAADAGGQSVGVAMDNGVVQGIQQSSGSIASALLGAVKSAIGSAANQAGGQSVGAALDNGIAAGISGNSGVVAAAASAVVSHAVQAAANTGQIKSPSQLFRDQIGLPIAQGLALGITDGTTAVEDSAKQLIGAGLAAVKGTGNGSTANLSMNVGASFGAEAAASIASNVPVGAPISISMPVAFYGTSKEDADDIQAMLDKNNEKLIQLIGRR